MKLIHLSDLHLGKRIYEYSLLEDQAYILDRIVAIIAEEEPDGVLIAGDIYDKSIPSAEAVQLCDSFLCRLAEEGYPLFIISGNHDSAERLAFGSRLMAASGVHISPAYDGHLQPLTLHDQWGPVNIYLLPFLKPVQVRRFFPQETVESYDDALRVALSGLPQDKAERNVLVAHQFVTGGARSESEELSVGGADNVDASLFAAFDYVALGHLHGPQHLLRESLRYCGTPLKYSLSEARQHKSLTVVELGEKHQVQVRTRPLPPLRDLRELKGTYAQLMDKRFYEGTATDDYLHITLTDEEDVPFAVSRLQTVYPHLLSLAYDNARTRHSGNPLLLPAAERKTPLALFGEFYAQQNGRELSERQSGLISKLLESIEEETL